MVYLEVGTRNCSALLMRLSCAKALSVFCIDILTPSTNLGMTSATALQLSINSSCAIGLLLC